MNINEQLEELYNKYWNNLILNGSKLQRTVSIANPLLIKVNEEEYEQSELKIMIFGQETWDWHKFSTSIKDGMDGYEKFFINENFYKGYKKSAFWKGFNYFKKELNTHFKDKKISYIWNNISKIGRNDGKTGVTSDLRELERNNFNVIKDEIAILKPDVVIFFTGGRDNDLKFNFEDIIFENIKMENTKKTKRKYKPCSKLLSKFLPNKSIRLYHPSYFGGFNYVKQDAIKLIK